MKQKSYKGLADMNDMFQWVIDIATEDCAAAALFPVKEAAYD